MSTHTDAFGRLAVDLEVARTFSNPQFNDAANTTERATRVDAAFAQFAKTRPNVPAAPDRAALVAAASAPHTADEVARVQHEQSKVRALLDAGQPISSVLANGDATRALAIADMAETLPEVMKNSDGSLLREIREAAADRLADLDVEEFAAVARANSENGLDAAWARVYDEVAQTRQSPSIESLMGVFNAGGADEYAAIAPALRGSAGAFQFVDSLDRGAARELIAQR